MMGINPQSLQSEESDEVLILRDKDGIPVCLMRRVNND
jgi:hypothetical protein